MRQDEEKEKDHRLFRAILSIQMLGISEGTEHTAGKEQTCGLCVHGILTPVDGVRPTQSPDPEPGTHFHTLQVTPPPQTLHLGSHDPWLGHQVSAGPLRWKQVGSCNLLGWQKEVWGWSPLPMLVPEKSSSLPFGSV